MKGWTPQAIAAAYAIIALRYFRNLNKSVRVVSSNGKSYWLSILGALTGFAFLLLTPVEARACSAAIANASTPIEFNSNGGTGTAQVVTTDDNGKFGGNCLWLAGPTETWVTITGGTEKGTGPATITYTVAPNDGPGHRLAVISIIGGDSLNPPL